MYPCFPSTWPSVITLSNTSPSVTYPILLAFLSIIFCSMFRYLGESIVHNPFWQKQVILSPGESNVVVSLFALHISVPQPLKLFQPHVWYNSVAPIHVNFVYDSELVIVVAAALQCVSSCPPQVLYFCNSHIWKSLSANWGASTNWTVATARRG